VSGVTASALGTDPSDRLQKIVEQGKALEAEGLPYPTDQIRAAVEAAIAAGNTDQADKILFRAETLYASASRDWTWVRALLRRVDELRELALRLGLDLEHLDSRVGNARARLRSGPLSQGSLERAAASASASLAVLNDTIPKYCVQEAQKLGEQIRVARNRGEDVTESTKAFSKLLRSVQDEHLVASAQNILEVRRAVARIPRAPTVGGAPAAASVSEEQEILLEARQLARRLHRIKGKAHDAQSAARLATQVRAALSEERRYGTPEEEIEALWNEVDRLTKERRPASAARANGPIGSAPTIPEARAPTLTPASPAPSAPVVPPPGATGEVPEAPTVPPGAAGELSEDGESDDDDPDYDSIGPSPLVPPDDVLPSSSRGRTRRTGR
jgi:hypothetical protein